MQVPWVWDGSTDQVLVMERVDGVSVGGSVIEGLDQEERNAVRPILSTSLGLHVDVDASGAYRSPNASSTSVCASCLSSA